MEIESVKSESEIQNFFRGTSILITGGTGFLGNILLDKLVRSCPDIKEICILIREKKGKDTNERFKSIFEDVVFERMKKECPDYIKKISAVVGDCSKPNLGLSENDTQMIVDKIDIIFHAAATVRFDAHLRYAVNINIRATGDLLKIAHSMKHLKAFVHVSTAFSNCAERKFVEEIFYNPPVTPESLIAMTEALSDETLERITPGLLGAWPNTYAFTKAIAEDVVRTKGKGLPVTIIRPAIVIPTAKEPIAGWINNFYGPTGVVAGAGLGLLRAMHADGECICDLVPCDSVVNATIACAWDIANTWKSYKDDNNNNNNTENGKTEGSKSTDIPIFNFVSSNAKPLKWKDYMSYNEKVGKDIPSSMAIWIYSLTLTKHKNIHQLYCIFLHLIPALIVDTFAKILGKEPKLWDAYEKIHKFSNVISYFSTQQWSFVDKNVRDLCNKLTPKDKELFDFDLTTLDWQDYFYHHIRGLRVYLMKDSLDTLPEARELNKKHMIAHYALVAVFWFIALYFAFSLSSFVYQHITAI